MSLIINGTAISENSGSIKFNNSEIKTVIVNGVQVWKKVVEIYPIGSETTPASTVYNAHSEVKGDVLNSDTSTWEGVGSAGDPCTNDYQLWVGDVTKFKRLTVSCTYNANGFGAANAHLLVGSTDLLLKEINPWKFPETIATNTFDISAITGNCAIVLRLYAKTESNYKPYSVDINVVVRYIKLD